MRPCSSSIIIFRKNLYSKRNNALIYPSAALRAADFALRLLTIRHVCFFEAYIFTAINDQSEGYIWKERSFTEISPKEHRAIFI